MSTNQIDTQRISKALAVLRQKVERVLEIAPNLLEINSLDELPAEKADPAEAHLWEIVAYGEYYVKRLLSGSSAIVHAKSKTLFDWYANEYKPVRKKAGELIGLANLPTQQQIEMNVVRGGGFQESSSLDEHHIEVNLEYFLVQRLDKYEIYALNELPRDIKFWANLVSSLRKQIQTESPEPHAGSRPHNANHLRNCFDAMYRCARHWIEELGNDDLIEDWREWTDLASCAKILQKPYFQPDQWVANEVAAPLTVITRDAARIPPHVQARLLEVFQSFVFGNWMAVIALSRCLLEYAILDREALLQKKVSPESIEVFDADKKPKRIGELGSAATTAFPELEESIEHVISYGHEVMHPIKSKKVKMFVPSKNIAQHCFEEISKIISTLYSQ